MTSSLHIQVLGPLSVRCNGDSIALPASKKTRALLGFLALAPAAHGRARLCDLLWDGPADPRGALRWSLSRIRSILEQDSQSRIQSDRDTVQLDRALVEIDLLCVASLVDAGLDEASTEQLTHAAALFRGELLEGLDLTSCYHFHAWVMRERDLARGLRIQLLRELTERGKRSEGGLLHARTWVSVDPLSEEAHLSLMQRLADIGRPHEARRHYETSAALLRRELGAVPQSLAQCLRELPKTQQTVAPQPVAPQPLTPAQRPLDQQDQPSATPAIPLVARDRELEAIEDLVHKTVAGQVSHLLFFGEAGLGKTRLLEELEQRFIEQGGRVLAGRAFEAEMPRSYGPWLDLLAGVDAKSLPPELQSRIEPFLARSASTVPQAEASRDHLFESVIDLLGHLASEAPLAVLLDDLQWLDEGSIALLHYIARSMAPDTRLLIASSARPGELIDNPPVLSVLRSLRRQHEVHQFDLAPLSVTDAAQIAMTMAADIDRHGLLTHEAVAPALDAQAIAAESEGNPMLLIELAHARSRGETELPESIQDLIQQRLDLLDEISTELLPWAATLGRTFSLDVLAQATGRDLPQLAQALETLEQRSVLRTTTEGLYDFAHDLVRRTVYEHISGPRRSILHRQIARSLAGDGELAGAIAGDIVHHAELGGDPSLAARAAVATGKQSLRLFANRDAWAIADRGLHLLAQVEGKVELALRMDLLEIKVLAAKATALRGKGETEAELQEAVTRAQTEGRSEIEAKGFYLLSVLHEDQGETSAAEHASIQAARSGRNSDSRASARQLANTARCIIQLEGDVEHARGLLEEAHTIAEEHALHEVELLWGRGLLDHWDGDHEQARDAIGQALALARGADDRWRECSCLAWLGILAYSLQDHDALADWSLQLVDVATRMGESGKAAFGHALLALASSSRGEAGADQLVKAGLQGLRSSDAKAHLAWVLNRAAQIELTQGNTGQAITMAQEALGAAEAVRRPSEAARARIVLARCSLEAGDLAGAEAHLQPLRGELEVSAAIDQCARESVEKLLRDISDDSIQDNQS